MTEMPEPSKMTGPIWPVIGGLRRLSTGEPG
jgi:hypothetical protein